jgi:demethylmenaquinone methyltransferase/2-methoxy-6-polyprenyl-1,4-benzoquinol methylase
MKAASTEKPSGTDIRKMFDAISGTYDKTNRLMTFGLDLYWRKKVASLLPKGDKLRILDCATGTCDQLLSLFKHSPRIEKGWGIDVSEEMLAIGKGKVELSPFGAKIELRKGSALDLPFDDGLFDCVTLSFGIRNVTDVSLCLRQILRVLRPGGTVLILETSLPEGKIPRLFHGLYVGKILPSIGGVISKQKQAYRYLHQTAERFPYGKAFCTLLEKEGFEEVRCRPLTFGAVSIYEGRKPG